VVVDLGWRNNAAAAFAVQRVKIADGGQGWIAPATRTTGASR
jgi:hypothetical protein